jgi:hypothetical protein
MGYSLILGLACPILAIRYALIGRASLRSKCVVGGLAFASFLLPSRIAGALVQLAVSLFVLLYLKAFSSGQG